MAKVEFKAVSVKEVFADYGRNFRMATSYAECEPIKDFDPQKHKPNLYEDIKLEGIHTPLGLVKLSKEESALLSEKMGRTINYRVARGHRRFKAVERIREDHPHMLDTIPANVYYNLSPDDEYRLMVDGVHIKEFNEYEVFDMIRKLAMNTRLSEEQIGHQIGRSRGYVQRRKWIMSLPDVVEENYRLKFETDDKGKPVPHVPMRDTDLAKLNFAANQDREKGTDPNSPDSEFSKVWNVLRDNGTTRGMEPKALTRKEMLEKLQWAKDPIVKMVIRYCAGDPVKLTDADEQMSTLRASIPSAD